MRYLTALAFLLTLGGDAAKGIPIVLCEDETIIEAYARARGLYLDLLGSTDHEKIIARGVALSEAFVALVSCEERGRKALTVLMPPSGHPHQDYVSD